MYKSLFAYAHILSDNLDSRQVKKTPTGKISCKKFTPVWYWQ